jgi:hypothetical protein
MEEAVRLHALAVAKTPPDHSDYLRRVGSLGSVLHMRFNASGDVDDLQKAIDRHDEVFGATHPDDPYFALRCNDYAGALLTAYALTADPRARARLLEVVNAGLSGTNAEEPALLSQLGALAMLEHLRTGNTHSRDQAIKLLQRVLDTTDDPHRLLNVGGDLARIAVEAHRWDIASATAQRCLAHAADIVAAYGPRSAAVWLRATQGMAALGAFAAARDGDLASAVELLELGCGVVAAFRFSGQRTTLAKADDQGLSDLVADYKTAAEALRLLLERQRHPHEATSIVGGGMPRALDTLQRARERLEQEIGPLWNPPSAATPLHHAATTGAHVAYVLSTDFGGLALTATPTGELVADPLDDLALGAVSEWTNRLWTDPDETRGAVVKRIVEWLEHALAPLISRLENAVVRLIPVGPVAWLPVPAVLATFRGSVRPVSIAVSAAVHEAAFARARLLEGGAGRLGLAALTNPSPVTNAGVLYEELTGAAQEGELLAKRFGAEHITGPAATRAAFLDLLHRRSHAIHLGAHGIVSPEFPDSSRVLLVDDAAGKPQSLTLAEITQSPLEIRLVFLAACWLGAAGTALPDEAVGFPNVMLQGGVGGVIAPLWPVDDDTTHALVAAFYTHWLTDGEDPAAALARAVAGVRSLDPFTWAAFTLTGA